MLNAFVYFLSRFRTIFGLVIIYGSANSIETHFIMYCCLKNLNKHMWCQCVCALMFVQVSCVNRQCIIMMIVLTDEEGERIRKSSGVNPIFGHVITKHGLTSKQSKVLQWSWLKYKLWVFVIWISSVWDWEREQKWVVAAQFFVKCLLKRYKNAKSNQIRF